jgi:hypothetical protein
MYGQFSSFRAPVHEVDLSVPKAVTVNRNTVIDKVLDSCIVDTADGVDGDDQLDAQDGTGWEATVSCRVVLRAAPAIGRIVARRGNGAVKEQRGRIAP